MYIKDRYRFVVPNIEALSMIFKDVQRLAQQLDWANVKLEIIKIQDEQNSAYLRNLKQHFK